MPKHEWFEELCALAVLGELGREEYDELKLHARACSSCERNLHEYADVIQHLPLEQVPLRDAGVLKLQESVTAENFLQRAREEGVVFSNEALKSVTPRPRWRTFWTKPILNVNPAMVALLVACVGIGSWAALKLNDRRGTKAQAISSETVRSVSAPPLQAALANDTLAELRSAQAELINLRRQLTAAQKDLLTGQAQLRLSQDRADATLQQRNAAIADLTAKIDRQNAAIEATGSALQKAQIDRDQAVASLVEQQAQIQSLQSNVKLALAKVEQEKQLNAAAHDVRELMGARKLHIVDVYDAENMDKPSKSFGRIIYTEGKSLIFYAFDLDQRHRGTKVSFMAWGERRGGERNEPRNLGEFSLDDEVQRRWVLKVNDPAKLKAMDTIFVTVESHRYPIQPSGQHFLQAFLGDRPNHP